MGELISVPLSIIFNKLFIDGVLPKDWKSAHITPIHKKGARSIVSNYQPVSLTSVYCKMMESIIKDHLLNHLLSNNLISPQEFGLIPSRSCAISSATACPKLLYKPLAILLMSFTWTFKKHLTQCLISNYCKRFLL